jgi:hypothetical protein
MSTKKLARIILKTTCVPFSYNIILYFIILQHFNFFSLLYDEIWVSKLEKPLPSAKKCATTDELRVQNSVER